MIEFLFWKCSSFGQKPRKITNGKKYSRRYFELALITGEFRMKKSKNNKKKRRKEK